MNAKILRKRRTKARNSHLVRDSLVERTVEAVSHVIQQHNYNSLIAHGYPIYVYQRLSTGEPCACSQKRYVIPNPSDYTDDGLASVSQLDSIASDALLPISGYNPQTSSVSKVPIQRLEEREGFDEDDALIVTDGSLDDFDMSLDAFTISACPLCFGTGVKNGYSCYQAERSIYDYSDVSFNNNVVVDKGRSTVEMLFAVKGAYIEIPLTFPKLNDKRPFSIRLFSDFTTVTDKFTAYLTDGVTKIPVDSGILTVTGSWNLVITTLVQDQTLTHVEVMFPITTQVEYCDIPNLVESFDPNRVYPYSAATFVVSPYLPTLKAWDVIADCYHNLLWLVVSAKPTYPASGQTWMQEIETRVIDPHEPMHALFIPAKNFVDIENNVYPSWSGYGKVGLTPDVPNLVLDVQRTGFIERIDIGYLLEDWVDTDCEATATVNGSPITAIFNEESVSILAEQSQASTFPIGLNTVEIVLERIADKLTKTVYVTINVME